MARESGYTWAELLAALALSGTLAGLAAPGFVSLGADLRRAAALSQILSTLESARRLAASSGHPVTVCVVGTDDRCARSGARFGVFAADGAAQRPYLEHSLPSPQTLRLNRDSLVFALGGRSATPVTFTLCDLLAPGAGRAIIVSRSARARVSDQGPAGEDLACPASGH